MAELPELFVERLKNILSEKDFNDVIPTFSKKRNTTFRVNTLKSDPVEIQKWLSKNGIKFLRHEFLDLAFILPDTTSREVTEWDIYKEGKIYLQNLSSQIPPVILDPKPGEKVLDLTAAPGSKATQIAAMMNREGELVANDRVYPRFKKLEYNVNMQVGEGFVKLYNKPGEVLPSVYPEYFDKVLVDAPCSSEGQFDLNRPKSLKFWNRHKIKAMRSKQFGLLKAGLKCLRPGGQLVYSTCTFAPEENEMVLDKILRKVPGVILEAMHLDLPNLREGKVIWNDKVLNENVKKAIRVLPDSSFEGFFVAKLSKD